MFSINQSINLPGEATLSDVTAESMCKKLTGHWPSWCLWRKGQIKEMCFRMFSFIFGGFDIVLYFYIHLVLYSGHKRVNVCSPGVLTVWSPCTGQWWAGCMILKTYQLVTRFILRHYTMLKMFNLYIPGNQ